MKFTSLYSNRISFHEKKRKHNALYPRKGYAIEFHGNLFSDHNPSFPSFKNAHSQSILLMSILISPFLWFIFFSPFLTDDPDQIYQLIH